MTRLFSFIVIVLALAAGACSSSDSSADGDDSSDSDSPSAAEAGESVDTDAPPAVPGAPLNPYDLRSGQCFNEGSWYDEVIERRIDLTAAVDCAQPHQKEMFHEAEFPAPNGAPFPGEAKMTEWSTQLCYEAFSTFVAAEYELSKYEIGFLQPTQETFEHPVGRHRRVTCYLFDPAEEMLTGTAKDAGV